MLWFIVYIEVGNIVDGSILMLLLDYVLFYKYLLCKIMKYFVGCVWMVINRKYNEEFVECWSSIDWM